MKKLLLTLMAVLGMTTIASATDVTFPTTAGDWTEYTWTKSGDDFTANVDGFTFLLAKASSTQALVEPDASSIRVYANAKLTITAPDGATMTKVSGVTAASSKATGTTVSEGWTNNTGTIKAGANQAFSFSATEGQSSITFDGDGKQLRIKSITITYTPAAGGKQAANLSFPKESYTAYLGEGFEAPALSKDTDGAVTYTSTVESVATVSADGAVKIVGLGTTVIEATTPATDTYYAGSAQYTLTVLDPNTLYSNACTSSDCGFTQVATTGTPWTINKTYGLKASGYISDQNTATDAIMASPVIDLNARQNVELDFEQAVNQFKANGATLTGADMAQINNYISVVICTNPNARAAEEWIKLADVQLPETQSWTFYANPTIKIDNKYAGRYVKIGFRYVSTEDMAGTWEIKNVTVKAQRETSAVENIAVSDEDALVEYYNLQGVRVAEPANGIFIRRQGNSVSKVYIR